MKESSECQVCTVRSISIAIVKSVKMARRKPDDNDSTGDPSKEKKSEEAKEVKKRPPKKRYDRKMIEKAVEDYRISYEGDIY